jgi:Polyketide cyclase / dehydrase and lipid transport
MLKKIVTAVVVAVAVLALVVAMQPADYKVERSVTVSAPAAVAWAQVADFHGWDAWSPWAKLDPGMKAEYGGPASGTGATYHWTGNDKVGEGRMTITGARPGADVVIRLEFLKPMEDVATTTFSFVPDGTATRVSWAMTGKLGFVGKAMCMLKSMERMIGPDFEKGLAALKTTAEAQARKAATEAAAAPAAAAVPAK